MTSSPSSYSPRTRLVYEGLRLGDDRVASSVDSVDPVSAGLVHGALPAALLEEVTAYIVAGAHEEILSTLGCDGYSNAGPPTSASLL